MNDNDRKDDDKGFLLHLQTKAQQKAKEYAALLHERQRLEMLVERAKAYLDHLNNFLRDEGQEPVSVKTTSGSGSAVGKPGNRSKALPIRKIQWDGMSIPQIIERTLNASPNVSFHPREVAPQIYEIQSDSDLHKVIRGVRSAMQTGARKGLWESTGRAQFRAKETAEQGRLVNG